MDYRTLSLDALKKQLGSCEQQLSTGKATIKSMAEELGIEPKESVIEAEIKKLEEEQKAAEEELEKVVEQLNNLDLEQGSEFSPEEQTSEEVSDKSETIDDFE